jgi:hypothetical protein
MFQGVLTSSDVFGPELNGRAEREKRKILEPVVEASFGIKSALLNIIFGVTLALPYNTRSTGSKTVSALVWRTESGVQIIPMWTLSSRIKKEGITLLENTVSGLFGQESPTCKLYS